MIDYLFEMPVLQYHLLQKEKSLCIFDVTMRCVNIFN